MTKTRASIVYFLFAANVFMGGINFCRYLIGNEGAGELTLLCSVLAVIVMSNLMLDHFKDK
jgi:hypothetical protein